MTLPFFPPSENNIRVIRWGRKGGKSRPLGMTWSTPAKKFQSAFRDFVTKTYPVEVQEFVRDHGTESIYALTVYLYLPLVNKGWLKGTAKSLYKRVDAGNRRKLVEDCLSTALGIDDSLFFDVRLLKLSVEDGEEPWVELFLESKDPRDYGVPDNYLGR